MDRPTRQKLVRMPGVSELGVASWLAKTRRRLFLGAIVITSLFVSLGVLTAGFMRYRSQSTTVNLVLISVCMLALMLTAFVHSLLVGDLIFPGRWRERVLLGKKFDVGEDDDVISAVGTMKDRSMAFYLVVALMLVANYGLYSLSTDDFFGYYSSYGYELTLLRSADSEACIRGLQSLPHPLSDNVRDVDEVRGAVVALLDHPEAEVRGWAFWVVGELRLFEATSRLRTLLEDDTADDADRAQAAEALGFLRNRDAAVMMATMLPQAFGRDRLAVGLLRGLGLARFPEAGDSIAPLMNVDLYSVRAHAFWALGQVRNQSYRDTLFELTEHGDDEEQCLAAEALKYCADEDDLVAAHALFARAPMTPCAGVTWERAYHWNPDRDSDIDMMVEESLRAKYLKVIRQAGGQDERDFFAIVANDGEQPDEIRRLARELALLIDQDRGDL